MPLERATVSRMRLFLARFFWLRGEPPRNGCFLVQEPNGKVFFEWRMAGAPGRREIRYWKRVRPPLAPPREYLSYNHRARLENGEAVPYVQDFY